MDTQTNDDVLKSDFFSRLSKMIPHKQRDTGKFYPIPRNFRMNVAKDKTILLFIRESNKDADGFTQGYVFIGPAKYIDHEGSKPMSIKWELKEPIPHYLWKESAKLRLG